MIDTHAHVNFNAFKDDSDEVIRRALQSDVWLVNVGSQYTTSERAVEIAERYSRGVYAAIGLHPIHLETKLVKIKVDKEEIEFETREEDFDYEKYKKLAQTSSKVVALGEIGLDYYRRPKTKTKQAEFKEKQKQTFIKQLELAQKLNLPVILHCRMAHYDLITTLQHYNNTTIRGVSHCFTGTLEEAKEYIKLGFYIGFNGLIFKKVEGLPNVEEIIREIPLEKILVETDCPYLSPPPYENQRCKPLYVKYVAEKIAKIKNLSCEEAAKITTRNARELFGI